MLTNRMSLYSTNAQQARELPEDPVVNLAGFDVKFNSQSCSGDQ